MTATVFNEDDCLSVDPFAGNFGDGEIVLSDKIVRAAKTHPVCCNICGGDVQKGARHRALVEAYAGKVMTFRFCPECCLAMATANDDDGRAWEARVGLYRGDRS